MSHNHNKPVRYQDRFVAHLYQDISKLIAKETVNVQEIELRLRELACLNNPAISRYYYCDPISGIPDNAFRQKNLFHFQDVEPVKSFFTSGTSGRTPGCASYSAMGLDLMHQTIITQAREQVFGQLSRPTIIRLVPKSCYAPNTIMAYGMELLAKTFGDPKSSVSIFNPKGLDIDLFCQTVQKSIVAERPVVTLGGTFAYVQLCDMLKQLKYDFVLPSGSLIVDAGGYKGRTREIKTSTFRALLSSTFHIEESQCINLFGMTECASQFYDYQEIVCGPQAERAKHNGHSAQIWLRDPYSWSVIQEGAGLVEIADMCILDRPYALLTGDWGICSQGYTAIVGRARTTEVRGCALSAEHVPAYIGQEV